MSKFYSDWQKAMQDSSDGRQEDFSITATIIKETEKAYLCDCGLEKPVWIPKSQIRNEEVISEEEVIELQIPKWLAKEKGLI